MKYDYLVFDFNGTIIDDAQLCLDILNKMLEEHHIKTVNMEEYREIFEFPVENYYRKVGFDFSKNPFSVLAVEFMDNYQPASLSCPLMDGCEKVFSTLHNKGYELVLLSASERHNLLQQMKHFNLIQHFPTILGISDIHAKSKESIAIDWRNTIPKDSKVLMVGDTNHDYEVAKVMNADCILIAKGHQSKRRLQQLEGARVIDDIKELLEIL